MSLITLGLNVARLLLGWVFLAPVLLFMGLALVFSRIASALGPAPCNCPMCEANQEAESGAGQVHFLVPGRRGRRHRREWARVP